MKRITLMLLATFFAVAGFSQKPLAKAETFANTTNELRQTQIQARGVSRSSTASRQKSPRKSLGLVTPPTDATPETYYTAVANSWLRKAAIGLSAKMTQSR